MSFRTDRNNNPAAFTTDIAIQAGLKLNKDFAFGDPFTVNGHIYHTAKLLGDPVALTIQAIDTIGFYTATGNQRWIYTPDLVEKMWGMLTDKQKAQIVGEMYRHEGGTELVGLFKSSSGSGSGSSSASGSGSDLPPAA